MESDVTLKFPYQSMMVVGSITYGNAIPFFFSSTRHYSWESNAKTSKLQRNRVISQSKVEVK